MSYLIAGAAAGTYVLGIVATLLLQTSRYQHFRDDWPKRTVIALLWPVWLVRAGIAK